jgi:TetR/AcrR family transcriptional repressor of nem operon
MKSNLDRKRLLDFTFIEVYRNGYNGANIDTILKESDISELEMNNLFESKKDLVLAMIEDRLIPRVRGFMTFQNIIDNDAYKTLRVFFDKMSENNLLIKHGCPLHKMMFETGASEPEIAAVCRKEFERITSDLKKVVEFGQKHNQIVDGDSKALAEYIILSMWGTLTRVPEDSSSEKFLRDTDHIFLYLKRITKELEIA